MSSWLRLRLTNAAQSNSFLAYLSKLKFVKLNYWVTRTSNWVQFQTKTPSLGRWGERGRQVEARPKSCSCLSHEVASPPPHGTNRFVRNIELFRLNINSHTNVLCSNTLLHNSSVESTCLGKLKKKAVDPRNSIRNWLWPSVKHNKHMKMRFCSRFM